MVILKIFIRLLEAFGGVMVTVTFNFYINLLNNYT